MTDYKGLMCSLILILIVCSCKGTLPITPVNTSSEGAVKGYDPIGYFTEKRPVKGVAEFEYVWNGTKWRFASAEHRAMFKIDPDKYAPKYGGYCAYAVSQGKIADIDPEAWTIFEGRLYLNLNKDVQRLWEKDMKEYIRKAEVNWPRMISKKG